MECEETSKPSLPNKMTIHSFLKTFHNGWHSQPPLPKLDKVDVCFVQSYSFIFERKNGKGEKRKEKKEKRKKKWKERKKKGTYIFHEVDQQYYPR